MAFDPLSVPIPEEVLDNMYASVARIVLTARREAAKTYERWQNETEDVVADYLTDLLYAEIPKGRELWEMLAEYPSLGKMDPPGGILIDGGIESVVRDAFYDEGWNPLMDWANRVFGADPEV